MAKTSDTHPLRIDSVKVPHASGLVGMTFCPGKKGEGLYAGTWNRDLDKDLSVISNWGTDALVTLVEDHELELLGVSDFRAKIETLDLKWLHLPIVDVSIPDERFENSWQSAGHEIRGILARGGKVVLHCRGGLGRTGLLAARLLVEFGMESALAVEQVRAARPGAIETKEQERHIYDYKVKSKRRTLDHYLGCLLGGAIGDALGAAVEFDALSDIRKKYGDVGIQFYAETFGRKGAITDDTQMTLFSAEGLLRACTRANHKGIGPSFLGVTYHAYRRWLATQDELTESAAHMDGWLVKTSELFSRRAPGNTCLTSLREDEAFSLDGHPSKNTSKGCGAVMRTAPVGLFMQSYYLCKVWDAQMRDDQSFEVGRDLGYLTHGHPSGYLPAAFLALLISRIISGDELDSALNKSYRALEVCQDADETRAAIDRARELAANPEVPPGPEAIAILGEGWVGEEALAIAIYCSIVAGDDFDFGVRLAVNHDGDSDSTGAITGNILGALLGRQAISDSWLEQLELREVIEQIAVDLFLGFQDGDDWWQKYPGY